MRKLPILAIALTLASCTYSDGERSGQIVKLSHKGIFFKTYEGELATLAKGMQTTMLSNTFHFSIKDQAVVDEVKKAMETGKQVTLTYEQVWPNFPWNGQTNYYITKVAVSQ